MKNTICYIRSIFKPIGKSFNALEANQLIDETFAF